MGCAGWTESGAFTTVIVFISALATPVYLQGKTIECNKIDKYVLAMSFSDFNELHFL